MLDVSNLQTIIHMEIIGFLGLLFARRIKEGVVRYLVCQFIVIIRQDEARRKGQK